ncbi:Protein of unknown function [Gryllus bimaculatus]|nr:Protein of unknown function [Gryllus bimaculatus]
MANNKNISKQQQQQHAEPLCKPNIHQWIDHEKINTVMYQIANLAFGKGGLRGVEIEEKRPRGVAVRVKRRNTAIHDLATEVAVTRDIADMYGQERETVEMYFCFNRVIILPTLQNYTLAYFITLLWLLLLHNSLKWNIVLFCVILYTRYIFNILFDKDCICLIVELEDYVKACLKIACYLNINVLGDIMCYFKKKLSFKVKKVG